MAAGNQSGGTTGSVLGTTPKGGTSAPVGSQVTVSYVGPSAVPAIASGSTPAQACQAITGANLRCDPEPAQTGTAGTFGTVTSTDPQSGQTVSNDTPVTVY